MRAIGLSLGAGVVDAITIDVDRGWDCRLEAEGAGDPNDAPVDFGAVDEHLLGRRLIVGDGLERDMRNNAADFFAFVVLPALVDEASGRATRLVLEVVPRIGC